MRTRDLRAIIAISASLATLATPADRRHFPDTGTGSDTTRHD